MKANRLLLTFAASGLLAPHTTFSMDKKVETDPLIRLAYDGVVNSRCELEPDQDAENKFSDIIPQKVKAYREKCVTSKLHKEKKKLNAERMKYSNYEIFDPIAAKKTKAYRKECLVSDNYKTKQLLNAECKQFFASGKTVSSIIPQKVKAYREKRAASGKKNFLNQEIISKLKLAPTPDEASSFMKALLGKEYVAIQVRPNTSWTGMHTAYDLAFALAQENPDKSYLDASLIRRKIEAALREGQTDVAGYLTLRAHEFSIDLSTANDLDADANDLDADAAKNLEERFIQALEKGAAAAQPLKYQEKINAVRKKLSEAEMAETKRINAILKAQKKTLWQEFHANHTEERSNIKQLQQQAHAEEAKLRVTEMAAILTNAQLQQRANNEIIKAVKIAQEKQAQNEDHSAEVSTINKLLEQMRARNWEINPEADGILLAFNPDIVKKEVAVLSAIECD